MNPNELKHYGIKGMHWGIRNEDPTNPRANAKAEADRKRYSAKVAAIRADLESKGVTEAELQAKFGVGAFINEHKKALLIGGAVLGAAALVGGTIALKQTRWTEALTPGMYRGFLINWTKDVELPAGSILTRVADSIETTPRERGFYACFKPDDIQRYRAAWTTFSFTRGNPTYSVDYKSLSAIKAPGGKRSVELVKSLAAEDEEFAAWAMRFVDVKKTKMSEKAWRRVVGQIALRVTSTADDPINNKFTTHLARNGYNSIIDWNDAGRIAKTPIKTLDGSMFEIVESRQLSPTEIKKAVDSYGVASKDFYKHT